MSKLPSSNRYLLNNAELSRKNVPDEEKRKGISYDLTPSSVKQDRKVNELVDKIQSFLDMSSADTQSAIKKHKYEEKTNTPACGQPSTREAQINRHNLSTLWFYAVTNRCKTGTCTHDDINKMWNDASSTDHFDSSKVDRSTVNRIFGKMPAEAIGIMHGNYAVERTRKVAAEDEDDCCREIQGRGSVFDRDMHDPASLREISVWSAEQLIRRLKIFHWTAYKSALAWNTYLGNDSGVSTMFTDNDVVRIFSEKNRVHVNDSTNVVLSMMNKPNGRNVVMRKRGLPTLMSNLFGQMFQYRSESISDLYDAVTQTESQIQVATTADDGKRNAKDLFAKFMKNDSSLTEENYQDMVKCVLRFSKIYGGNASSNNSLFGDMFNGKQFEASENNRNKLYGELLISMLQVKHERNSMLDCFLSRMIDNLCATELEDNAGKSVSDIQTGIDGDLTTILKGAKVTTDNLHMYRIALSIIQKLDKEKHSTKFTILPLWCAVIDIQRFLAFERFCVHHRCQYHNTDRNHHQRRLNRKYQKQLYVLVRIFLGSTLASECSEYMKSSIHRRGKRKNPLRDDLDKDFEYIGKDDPISDDDGDTFDYESSSDNYDDDLDNPCDDFNDDILHRIFTASVHGDNCKADDLNLSDQHAYTPTDEWVRTLYLFHLVRTALDSKYVSPKQIKSAVMNFSTGENSDLNNAFKNNRNMALEMFKTRCYIQENSSFDGLRWNAMQAKSCFANRINRMSNYHWGFSGDISKENELFRDVVLFDPRSFSDAFQACVCFKESICSNSSQETIFNIEGSGEKVVLQWTIEQEVFSQVVSYRGSASSVLDDPVRGFYADAYSTLERVGKNSYRRMSNMEFFSKTMDPKHERDPTPWTNYTGETNSKLNATNIRNFINYMSTNDEIRYLDQLRSIVATLAARLYISSRDHDWQSSLVVDSYTHEESVMGALEKLTAKEQMHQSMAKAGEPTLAAKHAESFRGTTTTYRRIVRDVFFNRGGVLDKCMCLCFTNDEIKAVRASSDTMGHIPTWLLASGTAKEGAGFDAQRALDDLFQKCKYHDPSTIRQRNRSDADANALGIKELGPYMAGTWIINPQQIQAESPDKEKKVREYAPNLCGIFAVMDDRDDRSTELQVRFRGGIAPFTIGNFALESVRPVRFVGDETHGLTAPESLFYMEHDGDLIMDDSCKLEQLHSSIITRYGKSIDLGDNDIRRGTWLTELLPLRSDDDRLPPPMFNMKFPDVVFNSMGRAIHVSVPYVISKGAVARFKGSGALTSEVLPNNYDPSRRAREIRYPDEDQRMEDVNYIVKIMNDAFNYLFGVRLSKSDDIWYKVLIATPLTKSQLNLIIKELFSKSALDIFDSVASRAHKFDLASALAHLAGIFHTLRRQLVFDNHGSYNECCSLGVIDCIMTAIHTFSNIDRLIQSHTEVDYKRNRQHRLLIDTAMRLWQTPILRFFLFVLFGFATPISETRLEEANANHQLAGFNTDAVTGSKAKDPSVLKNIIIEGIVKQDGDVAEQDALQKLIKDNVKPESLQKFLKDIVIGAGGKSKEHLMKFLDTEFSKCVLSKLVQPLTTNPHIPVVSRYMPVLSFGEGKFYPE